MPYSPIDSPQDFFMLFFYTYLSFTYQNLPKKSVLKHFSPKIIKKNTLSFFYNLYYLALVYYAKFESDNHISIHQLFRKEMQKKHK